MIQKITLFIAMILFSSVGWSQAKLIEKVTQKGDEVVIPYSKYKLDNGLTVVIHEDHSDPLVHVDVTYHVGSAREELNKSGFAHFFEHMMFQGSENVGDEQHFKIVSDAGGTLNGSTNRDRTNYYETVPSNQLEVMLWLEADRMGFFLDSVTQKKFEVQRATVKNEKGQNYDNRPYGRFREINAASLYPYGHPYSWLTIGKLEDLDRVDVNDLKKFFLRWYGPNNATLTIGGDVDVKSTLKLVEKYFGVIPSGPNVEPLKLAAPKLDSDRYVSYVDKNIRFPALLFTYPTVPQFHEDEPALDCLAEILGTGRSSFFYKKFVLTKKAIQASTFSSNSELAGEFTMFVLPFPGPSLADFEKEVRQILTDFEKTGVTDDDITKFKANREANLINGLASVSGKITQLARYETFLNNPNGIKKDLERYRNLTKEDVIRVFNKYIKGKPAVIQSVIPNENTPPAQADNYKMPTNVDNPFPTTDYSGLVYKRPAGDKFDRSKQPTPGAAPLVKVPDFWKDHFGNGMKIIGTESQEIPIVTLQLNINGGHLMDAYAPSKSGLAQLTAALMNESTENYSSEKIQEELRKLGSSISVSASDNRTTVNVNTLKKNLTKTLELMEEILMKPKFDAEDFDRIKKQQIEGLKSSQKDPSAIANNVFRKLMFGEKHVYALPSSGDETTVSNITVEDVKEFYNKYYAPNLAELVVVGEVDKKEIEHKLGFLKHWKKKDVKVPSVPQARTMDKTKLFLVDKANAPQSEIRIGYVPDLTYDVTGDYFKSYLMNYPLGGAFNSRINLNLREDKGWTYGASSNFTSDDNPGPFVASAGVKATATDGAVHEFMKEITNYYNDGITNDELTFIRNSIGQRDARSYETPRQKAGFLRRIVHYDLDKSFVKEQTQIIKTISKEEIDKLAQKYVNPKEMSILVVGDKASNIEKLKELGYEIIELDSKGNVVNDPNFKK